MVFGKQPHDIRVVTTASTAASGYVRSTIKAVAMDPALGKRKSHTIEHFWYNTWPDHGVPRKAGEPLFVDDTLAMLADVRAFRKKCKSSGPILVHCSAGIGRTGTFIALDHATQLLQTKSEVNLLEVIANIRQDRCAMVQHAQQYKYVHHAVLRYSELSGYDLNDDADKKNSLKKRATPEEEKATRAAEKKAAAQKREAAPGRAASRRRLSSQARSGELNLGQLILFACLWKYRVSGEA